MWTGRDVSGRFHDEFEVVCELVEMIEEDVMT
jgi:hypothetical protein